MLSDTVEPSLAIGVLERPDAPPRPTLRARLEATGSGQLLLSCLRWTVVFALILAGYIGADIIHAGVQRAGGHGDPANTATPMLAATASHE